MIFRFLLVKLEIFKITLAQKKLNDQFVKAIPIPDEDKRPIKGYDRFTHSNKKWKNKCAV